MTGPNTLLSAALAYATAGVPIVPLFEPAGTGCACGDVRCRRPAKHPRNRGGLTNASTDPAVIEAWWQRWPGANIGGRTGDMFDVCDVDGPDGAAAVRPLLGACHGVVPLVRTGSGGWHLLFAPTGLGCRVRFLPGTDWRGVGGYVVLPPSRHICGNRYETVRALSGSLRPVPATLLTKLQQTSGKLLRSSQSARTGHARGYGPTALAREADALRAAAKGGRNDALNRAAFNLGQLVTTGHLTAADVEAELTAAALAAGLDETETARTIRSGLNAGQQHPRTRTTSTLRR